jgi:predicted small secreted protein
MNKKHLSLFVLITAFAALFTSGCRTMEGAGEDVERAGEKIQENAER